MSSRARRAVAMLVQENITESVLRVIAPAPCLLLRSAMAMCREIETLGSAPSTSPTSRGTEKEKEKETKEKETESAMGVGTRPSIAAYNLIGRSDLAANLQHQLLQQQQELQEDHTHHITTDGAIHDVDGTLHLLRASKLRFSRDRRMNEVVRLLTSDKPNRIVVVRQPEDSDHDVETRKQSQLELECRRSTALPLARGMLTLSVDNPERLMHEVLPMPTISLLGRVPPSTATLQLDLTANGLPPTYLDWVRFHNGVAAGLRCAPRVDDDQISPASITTARDQETQDEFTRTCENFFYSLLCPILSF